MIFLENRLLADDSHETSYFILFENLGKTSQNAVVIGALRVNYFWYSEQYFSTDWQI